jgi:hypothetical protein
MYPQIHNVLKETHLKQLTKVLNTGLEKYPLISNCFINLSWVRHKQTIATSVPFLCAEHPEQGETC